MQNTVLLVTDDTVLATGLAHVLEGTNDLRLSAVCSDTESLSHVLQRTAPCIVLIDMNIGSLALLADVRKSSPQCHICVWARCLPDDLAYEAMRMGVRGILGRTLPLSDIVSCLRKLARNEVWFEEKLMAGFLSKRPVCLTRRESQLVTLLAQGMSNKKIAYTLSLAEGTVKVYMSRLFEKLSVKDRLELALYGLRHFSADVVGQQLPITKSPHTPIPGLFGGGEDSPAAYAVQ